MLSVLNKWKAGDIFKALTNSDDFLFANGTWVNFRDKLLDGNVGVLIHVWINIGLQRL